MRSNGPTFGQKDPSHHRTGPDHNWTNLGPTDDGTCLHEASFMKIYFTLNQNLRFFSVLFSHLSKCNHGSKRLTTFHGEVSRVNKSVICDEVKGQHQVFRLR